MFLIFELLLIISILYLAINLAHYFWNKMSGGDPSGNFLFGLSDKWTNNEKKEEEK